MRYLFDFFYKNHYYEPMLPIISEENFQSVIAQLLEDIPSWRKSMIHYIKEENPEVNSAIVELANQTDLDPKAVATGAYAVYKMLENAFLEQGVSMIDEE